ncbi:hypothetical protein A4G99_03710 [Haladaptatus sp. R4]|nr:hypothetical protein A4G99_03710 [Haladaptatus sp. R4]
MLLMVISTVLTLYSHDFEIILAGALFIVFIVVFADNILNSASSYQARKSETTDKDLIYYEFNCAIQDYQSEDYREVYNHMSNINSVIRRGQRKRQGLSYRSYQWFRIYITALEKAQDKEQAISETFGRFAEEQLKNLMNNQTDLIRDIVDEIDYEEDSIEMNGTYRAILDVWKTFTTFVSSGILVAVLSIIGGVVVIYVFDEKAIGIAIPSVILLMYQINLQEK